MSRKKINITETISELKQIIEKYGGIPSQQIDKAAYAKINYVIKRYADSEEVKMFLSQYNDIFMQDNKPKKGKRVDIQTKVEEFKKIIEKYGKIPSQNEDRKAYANITYYIKNYTDTPEIQKFLSEYEDIISFGNRSDFKTRLAQLAESLRVEERIPAVKENQELYVAVRYFFAKNSDNQEVIKLKKIYAHNTCYPLPDTKFGPRPESKKIKVITLSGKEYIADENPDLLIWKKNVAYEFIEHVYNTYKELPAKKTKPMQLLFKQIAHWERYNVDCSTDVKEPLYQFLYRLITLGCQDETIVRTYNSFDFVSKKVQNRVRKLLIENGSCAISYIAQCANPGKPVSETFAYYYYYVLLNDKPKSRVQLQALGELYSGPTNFAILRVHYRDYSLCNISKIRQEVILNTRNWDDNPPQNIEEWRQYGCHMFFFAERRSNWNEMDPLYNKTYIQSSFDNGHPYFRYYNANYNHRYLDYYLFLLENGYRLQDRELIQDFNPIKLCNNHDLNEYDYETVYKILCLHEDCIIDESKAIYCKNESGYYLLMLAPGTINYTVKHGTYHISMHAHALCKTSLENIRLGEGLTGINGSFSSCISLRKIIIPQSEYKEYRYLFSKKDATFFYNYEEEKIPVQAIFDGTKLISVPYVEEYNIPEGTTEIDRYAFSGSPVKNVTIAGSVKDVCKSLFWCHHHIEHVVLNEGIETIGSSFFGHCESLHTVIFPKSLREIGGGQFFDGCKELKTVHLKGNVERLGYRTFQGCNIEYLRIDGHINRTFEEDFSVYGGLPVKRIEFNGGIGWIGSTFNGCKNLEEIIFMGEYQRFEKEGMNMLEKCDKLKRIIIRKKYNDWFINQIHESKRNLVIIVD